MNGIVIGGTCKDCTHFKVDWEPFGDCTKRDAPVGASILSLTVSVVGPDFGCIHWKAKP